MHVDNTFYLSGTVTVSPSRWPWIKQTTKLADFGWYWFDMGEAGGLTYFPVCLGTAWMEVTTLFSANTLVNLALYKTAR